MFDFHYDYIRKKYDDKAELLFTDTDSLFYLIHTNDFYKDISHDIKKSFILLITLRNIHLVLRQVIGKFKDEVACRQITHFVGLRPKLYSYKVEEGSLTKKCKGIKKNVVKREISFEDYVQCLFSGETQMRAMNFIKSNKHVIYSVKVNKIALSSNDNKRLVCEDQIHTLALR